MTTTELIPHPKFAFDQTTASSVLRARELSQQQSKLTPDDMAALASLIISDLATGAITVTRASTGTRFIDAVLEDDVDGAARFWVQFVTGKRPQGNGDPARVYDPETNAFFGNAARHVRGV